MANEHPDKTKVALTADQIAKLDLLIEKKKGEGLDKVGASKSYDDDLVNNLNNVAANATVAAVGAGAMGATPAAAITAAIGAAAAATGVATQYMGGDYSANEKAVREVFQQIGRQMPLDALIALRNAAIEKK
jgi:isocitrate dehydrogenase